MQESQGAIPATIGEEAAATQVKVVSSRNRVLFADDDEELHVMIKHIFENSEEVDFDFDFVNTAGGACSMMNIYCFDGVVLDWKLPDFTGLTVGAKIRERDPTVPMAFMTNYSGDEIEREVNLLGADYWPKIPTISEEEGRLLVRKVKELISKKRCHDTERRLHDDPGYQGDRRRTTDHPLELSASMMQTMITQIRGRGRVRKAQTSS